MSEAVRQRAKDAMFTLMQKDTIENISVQNILKLAGISRSSFYRCFHDKYDLMFYCYRATVDEFCGNIHTTDIYNLMFSIFSFLRDNKPFFQNVLRYKGTNDFSEQLYQYSFRFYKERLLCTGKPALSDIEADCAAFASSGGVEVIRQWLDRGMTESPDEMARRFCRFIPVDLQRILGIASEAGTLSDG
ncbi:MAG: TetR-like C-terminal domain-containing protein [Synergistaceae bacterium]|nr:TetR-like C-terminal domain-containing protein [Synergistaceae bacterium]